MSKLRDFIVGKHTPVRTEIPKKLYDQMKSEMSEDEFKKKYKYIDYQGYFKVINDDPGDSALTELLLHKILKEQALTNQKLSMISTIITASFVCGLIAALVFLFNFIRS